jgi:hypothetical protein
MPAKNPRLTVTLAPETQARLRRISALTGNSQSSLIGTLLDTQGAVFDRLIRVLEAAEQAKEVMKGKQLAEDMKAAQERIESQFGLALEDFDVATGSLLKEAEAIKRRSQGGAKKSAKAPSRSAAAAVPTPISNRGVRSTPKKSKNLN